MTTKSKAILFMFLSGFFFGLMAVSVKLAGDVPLVMKLLFRNLVAVFISFSIIRQQKVLLFGKRENQKYLFGRALFGTIAMATYFYAIGKIPIADATMLNNLSPFVVTLLAFLFLKEKLSKMQIPALFIVFFASLLIIKPRFDLTIIPALAGAASALLSGFAYTLVKYLGNKEHPATIVFYFSFVSTFAVLPFALYNFHVPDTLTLVYLLGIGVFASGGQMFMTYSYKLAKASEVSIIVYVNVLFTVLFGWLVWTELPDIYSIIGGSIIILVAALLFRYNKKNGTEHL